MSKGGKIGIALFLGLMAALFGGLYLSGQREAIIGGSEVVRVYVAAENIPANVALTPSMITTREVPRNFTQPGSVTAAELPDKTKLTGVTLVPIRETEQILRTKLFEGTTPALSTELKSRAGMVAVGVQMKSLQTSISGLVRPGDKVDVLASFEFEKTKDESYTEIRPLFQNVEVLGVDEVTPGAVKPHVPEKLGDTEEGNQVKTITLALRPDGAQEIILAQQLGQIWLVLRAAGDNTQHDYAIWNNERLIGPAVKLWKAKDARLEMLSQLARR